MIPVSFMGISFAAGLFVYLGIAAVAVFLALNRGALRKRPALTILRTLAIAALFGLLASPYIAREESILQETTSILIIDDRTDSMELYERALGSEVAESIGSEAKSVTKVDLRNISTDERSAIGDEIYQGVLGSSLRNNAVVLASDGLSNEGTDPLDVASFAAEANTRIFPLVPERLEQEVYVKGMDGSRKSPVNSEYVGSVLVGSEGQAEYGLRVEIDGEPVLETEVVQGEGIKELPFSKVFNSEGSHHITASITTQTPDSFQRNNVFRKVVEVIERARVLLVTDTAGSSLQQVLEDIYDVDVAQTLPEDLGPYNAVVLDDQPEAEVSDTEALRDFLNSGGGLVVVGGNSSYERGGYYESGLENLLPVKSREAPRREGQETNIVILIDISGSTGNRVGGDTKIDVEKAIAVRMVRDLSEDAAVGVVAFNSDAFSIYSLKSSHSTSALEEKISRLSFGGGTYVQRGLTRARGMLSSAQGSKYVILISDGVTNYPVQAFQEASEMARAGMVVHTIGVGFDTDEGFMRGLADRGNGVYFSPDEAGRVKFVFGEEEDEGGDGGPRFVITDTHHFITEGLNMGNVSISGFNEVSAKSSAQVLGATSELQPLLSVWRFGLGRVVSLTLDNGRRWAGSLYSKGNSRIISSAVNWAIGDPEKRGGVRLDCTDAGAGETVTVVVSSEADYPPTRVGGEEVRLNRLDDSNYYFDFVAGETGFVEVESSGSSCEIAVNYPEEYGEFGVDIELLRAMAEITGGAVYHSGGIASLASEISDYVVEESTGAVIRRAGMQLWFALAALLLFFADMAVRRISEIRRGGKV